MSYERRLALMALAALPGLGPVNLRKLDKSMERGVESLLEMDDDEQAVWCSGRILEQLMRWKDYFNPEQVLEELSRMDADFITFEEDGYPSKLLPYPDRPIGLYRNCAGQQLEGACLAIVGTRQPSGYGRKVAREFSEALSRSGYTIVSGMAEGIDTEAHRAALASGGRTAAVLGGGLKHCYPSSNRGLMQEIRHSAGIWSEFPLWRRADRRSFPQRNRIVSGVSDGVLVVESGTAGGSLITARMAAEQGKPVYVLPGRIDSPESAGCHALIRDGATLVTTVEEILEDLSYLPSGLRAQSRDPSSFQERVARPELTGLPSQILETLGSLGSAHVDRISGEIAEPVAKVLQALMEMELSGHLVKRLDGRYERA